MKSPVEFGAEFPHHFFDVKIFDKKTSKEVRIGDFGYLGYLDHGFYDITLCVHNQAKVNHVIVAYRMNKDRREGIWNINEIESVACGKIRNSHDSSVSYDTGFTRTIKVMERKDNRITNWISYPDNGFRVIILSSKGKVTICDMSIFAQDGRFWFSSGVKYSFHVSKEEGGYYLTHKEIGNEFQWENLRNLILQNAVKYSLDISPNLPMEEPIIPKLGPGQLFVKWFNPTYGKGAVAINDDGVIREASIHYSRVLKPKNEQQPRIPEEGKIYFTRGGIKMPESNTSTFAWEVSGLIHPV